MCVCVCVCVCVYTQSNISYMCVCVCVCVYPYKERFTHLNAEFQRIARRDKKVFLSDQHKEKEETIEGERLEISARK